MYSRMTGLQEDVVTGLKKWQDPVATVKGYADIPTLPVGVIAGVAIPVLALLYLLKGRR